VRGQEQKAFPRLAHLVGFDTREGPHLGLVLRLAVGKGLRETRNHLSSSDYRINMPLAASPAPPAIVLKALVIDWSSASSLSDQVST
jgi:hypothetical protein